MTPGTDFGPTADWANDRLRLILTGECNLDCSYCHNEGQRKTNFYFADTLMRRVIEMMATRAPHSVTLSGGEPLLHPQLAGFVAEIRRFCSAITLCTNGHLLTPKGIDELTSAGVTKIRLGVDSLFGENSRPSSRPCPTSRIREVIDQLLDSPLSFELNIVLTDFNVAEIPSMLRFCQTKKVSAKVFEQLKVRKFGTADKPGVMEARPVISFEEFKKAVRDSGFCGSVTEAPGLDGANFLLEGEGFSWRYCRYLCPFGLCYIKGTKIDPEGVTYICMNKRFAETLSPLETLEVSLAKIAAISQHGCCHELA